MSDKVGDHAKTAKRGRPASPIGRHTRNAEAARRYRARKRIEREARRDPRQPATVGGHRFVSGAGVEARGIA